MTKTEAQGIGGKFRKISFLMVLLLIGNLVTGQSVIRHVTDADISVGAARLSQYLPRLESKRVALVANHSSLVDGVHLADTLLALGVDLRIVFAPEHGFRGTADAGAKVKDSKDSKTGLPVKSLYGNNKKPSAQDLANVEVVVFDMQDVGVRFYTYISTMHYVMEACAEQNKEIIILDRPNPNGFYVDGPVLDPEFSSFVGIHPIPLVHGLTVGELAGMISGEGWLANRVKPRLTVVPCEGYHHNLAYELPVNPSPNLRDMSAIYLYPALGLFEGTVISCGRGTDYPFQTFGHPELRGPEFTFVPEPKPGAQKPRYQGKTCYGYDLRTFGPDYAMTYRKLYLHWLFDAYSSYAGNAPFFYKSGFFNLLAGTDELKEQIISNATEEEIRESWEPQLTEFKIMRKRYLIYPDFEQN